MVPKQLIAQLNSGRCFALIGSGPSTEMGYPSWRRLSEIAISFAKQGVLTTEQEGELDLLLGSNRFPELFAHVADHVGGMPNLQKHLKRSMNPQRNIGKAYEYLARWPFRCYLTTNYDDEIHSHLKQLGVHYATVGNSQADLVAIDAHSNERIVKLHGDLESADGFVLDDRQYREFRTEGKRQYFREKLKAIFSMVPVVVVGHSLSDPDISLVLEQACEINSLDHPIYMLLANVSKPDERRYREQFNVQLLSYEDSNGDHSQLLQLLKRLDRFVIHRNECGRVLLDPPDPAESNTAASLYLYSRLGVGTSCSNVCSRALAGQILSIVAAGTGLSLDRGALLGQLMPKELRSHPLVDATLDAALTDLQDSHLIDLNDDIIKVTSEGHLRHNAVIGERTLLEREVTEGLRARLKAANPGDPDAIDRLTESLRQTLMAVFRKRGLAATSMLFHGTRPEPSDMPELFEAVFSVATEVNDFHLKAAFSDFVWDLLTNPSDTQKTYLVNLSQGYFAYHAFGSDPSGAETRRLLAAETLWVLDSNLLIPLLARGCRLHEFATKTISRMQSVGIVPATTSAFIREAWKSYEWACHQVAGLADADVPSRLLQTIKSPGYSDNPFLDGYINGVARSQWNSFTQFKSHLALDSEIITQQRITQLGITRLDLSDFEDPLAESAVEIEILTQEIVDAREDQGTLRGGEIQAGAEAEVMQLIRKAREGKIGVNGRSFSRAYFVSTSTLLDRMYGDTDGLISWFPEMVYRHLHCLSTETLDVEEAFDALTSNYYSIGVEVVDDTAYRRYFDPIISEARVTLTRQKEEYESALLRSVKDQKMEAGTILGRFDVIDDLEKPRFAIQAGWIVARQEEKRRRAAEARAASAEAARREESVEAKKTLQRTVDELRRKELERKRHEEGRLKNLMNPKHIRKRARQAKKRKKGK